eukprot:TRINITY_DN3799_c0_g1_i2.p1 TRINITY_DN3799_c0_g1~~TRINITY_DN3799_c0_g1_i2.p1  ORF type:complete len:111 (-),score=31.92 TRINITY_DN3799_c0_g1_i2:89-379(-)
MSNIIRQATYTLGATGFIGWICWKGLEGTDDDIYKQFKTEETNKKSYDEKAMMIEVLKRGGDSNLRKVREQTNEVRMRIAEEHTVYNIPVKEPSEK